MTKVRIIGGIQIVLALVAMGYVWRLNSGMSEGIQRLSRAADAFHGTLIQHKAIYRRSAENVFTIASALNDMGSKVKATADTMKSCGTALQSGRFSKFTGGWGRSLSESGSSTERCSQALVTQAGIIRDYQQQVYPQTMAGFDAATEALEASSKALAQHSGHETNTLSRLLMIFSLFFLLNGIALWLLGTSRKPQEA